MPKLHFLSAAVGFVIAGLLALTTSQASPPPATLNPAAIRIEYMPHPRDMVQIKEGTSYTVPAARLFVLTGLGSTSAPSGPSASLLVNGHVEVTTVVQNCGGTESRSVVELPLGFTVPPGSTLTVLGGISDPDDARAWGYLASQ